MNEHDGTISTRTFIPVCVHEGTVFPRPVA